MWNDCIALKLHHHPQDEGRSNGWAHFGPISELHVMNSQVRVARWGPQVEVTVVAGLFYRISWCGGRVKVRVAVAVTPIPPCPPTISPPPQPTPPPRCFFGQCPSLPSTAHSITITLNWTSSGWTPCAANRTINR